MPPPIFPLWWESTGDQWWYASPIDCAAANGLYDVVIELIHQDTNLLVKLTSLRRIRRLETVWDDGEGNNCHVALNRSRVARRLLEECEIGNGDNSLIRAGYGGWLLYTAASAGDLEFVKKLVERDPLLVFGEGEYGVTDILYAAARGRNDDVFSLLLDFALLPADIAGVEEINGDKLTEKQLLRKRWLKEGSTVPREEDTCQFSRNFYSQGNTTPFQDSEMLLAPLCYTLLLAEIKSKW